MKSSSHLTRAVFRAILNNRPYAAAECRRHTHQMISRHARHVRPLVPYTQRRTRMFGAIFGALENRGFEGAKNTPKNLEIALGKLVDVVRSRRTQSRGPSDIEALDALRFLFISRLESQRRLTRNEVYLATEVFKHFQEQDMISESTNKTTLSRKDLNTILKTLALPSDKEIFRSDTRALATMVFAALPLTAEQSEIPQDTTALLPVYVTILARTGSAIDALKLLRQSTDEHVTTDVRVWLEVLKGLATEGRRKDFDNVMAVIQGQSTSMRVSEYEDLVTFLSNNNKVVEAKQVYEMQVANQVDSTVKEVDALLALCIRTGELEYGKTIAQALELRASEEDALGSLLVWAAALHQDPTTLRHEMSRILHLTSPDTLSMAPFNRLTEFAFSTNNPEMAAAVLEIARSIGQEPDGRFFALQLEHALRCGDIVAAKATFEELTRQDIPKDGSDITVLNKFIAALAFAPDPDHNLLMRVTDYFLERNADFDAEALAGICRVFLLRDELEELTGLLRHRVDFYPAVDRARISAVFQEFILDPGVKLERAFDSYELFRVAFPETPVEQRLPIMQSFFDRSRPDLACLVFGHMRQREDVEARPTADAYGKCFAGIAQCRDVDGLQMVYNMLKLDLEVEPTTKVRNGLMLAYIACQMPYTAMIDHFWKIMDSREGPSYSTFEVAFRACESWIPQGGYEARKIMAIVQAWNLEITKELYDCYIGAIAGQSEFENTIELIEEMENETGERPDVYTIGTFYNAIPWQYRKDEVEKWAKKAYPDLWEELETFGDEIDEEWEIRYFKIDRSIDIEDPPLFAMGKYDPQISRAAVQALEPPPEKDKPSENSLL